MKAVASLLTFIMASSAWATGEYVIFKCTSSTYSGDVVSISGCTNEGELIACENEYVPYVTVTKEHWSTTPKMTPAILETVKYPGVYFDFTWEEELFYLNMKDKDLGNIVLSYVTGEVEDPNFFSLKTKNFDNVFKVVGCEYTSNEM